MLELLVTILLAATPTTPPAEFPAATAWFGDKFEDLKQAFERAAVGNDQTARRAALEALVASSNPAAAAVIGVEYTRVTAIVDEQEAKAFRARGLVERKQILIEQWKLRATHDESAKSALDKEIKALDEQKQDLAKAERKLGDEGPWRKELAAATERLLAALSPEKRKKFEADLLADASENPSLEVRAASADLLGAVGSLDSAGALARLAQSLGDTSDKLIDRLPKMMIEVHKMEERLAKEAGKQSDGFSKATYDQYDAVKRDAAEVRKKIHETSVQSDRAARAAAAGIVRGSGKELDEVAASLIRAWKKSKGRGRLALLQVLSSAKVEGLRAALRTQLAAETEPLSRAEWIDTLAAQGDAAIAPDLLQKHLLDPAWLVKSRAAHALATLRSREA
ncbi:MAG: hypothetical protein ABI054_08190, partial [Planctomycetota bacterium]